MMRALLFTLLPSLALAAPGPERHVLTDGLADATCVVLAPREGEATVVLPDGPVMGRMRIVLADGRIAALGADVPGLTVSGSGATWSGRDCAVVDIQGKTVTPGLIEVSSSLGLVEVSLEDDTHDQNQGGTASIRAGLRVADAYNPRSTLIPVQRVEGVTSAVIHPSGGQISGQAAFVDLAGATQAQAVVSPSVAVDASLGGSSSAAALHELARALDDARFLQRSRAAYDRGDSRPLVASADDLEALLPVVRGEQPLVIGADRAADIEALLRFAKDQRVRVVIRGGAEAWMHAQALAAAKVPVIVDAMVYGAGGFDQVHGRADNAALLAQAGVPLILTASSSHNARLLRQYAGNAVRGGLDPQAALNAITATPAAVFGQPDRGVLRKGAVANVVVWDGDPLELKVSVHDVFIQGRAIPLDSRQWQLFLKYRDLPGTPAPALSLPVP